jgi:hypothetical protein
MARAPAAPDLGGVLAIRRRCPVDSMFSIAVSTRPEVAGSSSAGAFQNDDHSDRAHVRFAHPGIQIYDAYVVDLYQRVCAGYLVGVEVQKQRQSAVDRLSTEFSERITLASKNPSCQ